MAGGGEAGELDEDKLDKGTCEPFSGNSVQLTVRLAVDLFQQHILKQGEQVRTDGLSLSP